MPPELGGPQWASSVTPDGKFVLYSHTDPRTRGGILIAPLDGSGGGSPLIRSMAAESQPYLSPDGAWLAFLSDQSGRSEVYVQRLRDASTRIQVSLAGGTEPRWRSDGREIFFLDGRVRLFAADVTLTGTTPVVGVPHLLLVSNRRLVDYDVTPDGQRFLLAPDSPREGGNISAVLHWQSLLR